MPSKNSVKIYAPEGYYHVYNRGVNKQNIFEDEADYTVFLSLLKRYLCEEPARDKYDREYPYYGKDIMLLAFCLMPNHFHLFIYQKEANMMTALMRGLLTSYTGYFNKKYKRIGHLFQGVYKASLIKNDSYFEHISRYIHLNPDNYKNYEWSSLPYYLGKKHAEWVRPQRIMENFNNDPTLYEQFLDDYENYEKSLDDINYSLADR